MQTLRSYRTAFFTLLFLLISSPAVYADSISVGFVNITNNDATDAATAGQFFVDINSVANPNQAQFVFRNMGPAASSIADVYFDDGTLLGIASITSSAGVSFSQGGSPPNLPGGGSLALPFETTAGFLADSDAPVQPNGVNPGETLTILFDLINGKTYADTVAALADPTLLRIGIHVQGYEGGGSESFINSPRTPPPPPPPGSLPVPGSLLLFGTSFIGLGLWFRKK